jgi:hypothetical protein
LRGSAKQSLFVGNNPENGLLRMNQSMSLRTMLFVTLALGVVYSGFNTAFHWKFVERQGCPNYDMLGQAGLAGHLYVKEEVDEARLKSGDPLNPLFRGPCLYDTIIWKGKYYLQHEPLPAAFHAAWIAVTHHACLTGVMVVLSGMGCFLVLGILLTRVREVFFPQSPPWIVFYSWLSFGLSGIQLYMTARPVIYHEAILLGNFFLLSGCLLLFEAWRRAETGILLPTFSGVMFGAAITCRVPLVLYPVMFTVCAIVFLVVRQERSYLTRWNVFLPWVAPIIAFIGLLLAYNYLRFGTPFDFGRTHVIFPKQLDYVYLAQQNRFYRLAHVPFQLYNYLLALPELSSVPPFVEYPFDTYSDGNIYVVQEMIGCLFLISPALVLCFFAPRASRYSERRRSFQLMLSLCIVSTMTMFITYLAFVRAAPRYTYDFFPLLFILGYCGATGLWAETQNRGKPRRLVMIGLLALFAINMALGCALGIQATKY